MLDLQERLAATRARTVFGYTIPETLRSDGGPVKLGLCNLTAEQEIQASRLGRLDYMKAQYAAIKMSIVEFDGKVVNNADGAVDSFWDRADPKLRSLILQTYNKMTSPTAEEQESFFKSEEIKVA